MEQPLRLPHRYDAKTGIWVLGGTLHYAKSEIVCCFRVSNLPPGNNSKSNIPILPQSFLTFASKSSVGPSYVANGQEDHKRYT